MQCINVFVSESRHESKPFVAKHTANMAIFAVKMTSGIYLEPNFILKSGCMPEKKKMKEIKNLICKFLQRTWGEIC